MNALPSLPDDVSLIALQYCEMSGILNTRKYQSAFVVYSCPRSKFDVHEMDQATRKSGWAKIPYQFIGICS